MIIVTRAIHDILVASYTCINIKPAGIVGREDTIASRGLLENRGGRLRDYLLFSLAE